MRAVLYLFIRRYICVLKLPDSENPRRDPGDPHQWVEETGIQRIRLSRYVHLALWPWHWWPAVTLNYEPLGTYHVILWFIGWKKRRNVLVKKSPSFSLWNLSISFKCNWIKFFCSKCPLPHSWRLDELTILSAKSPLLRLFWYSYRIESFSVKIFVIITSYKFQSDEWRWAAAIVTLHWNPFLAMSANAHSKRTLMVSSQLNSVMLSRLRPYYIVFSSRMWDSKKISTNKKYSEYSISYS